MKKNRMMRLASILLVCVLLTTSVISGTFAKYTTTVSDSDAARVAKWGFEPATMNLDNLFLGSYTNVVSNNGDDVIAPGTEGSTTFAFAFDETNGANGPEVAYTFSVSVVSSCDDAILANPNIVWQLDSNGWGSWNDMIADITALSGDISGTKQYAPNTLPDGFTASDDVHTIAWKWVFDENATNVEVGMVNGDVLDTAMGNDDVLADCSIAITITATQVD